MLPNNPTSTSKMSRSQKLERSLRKLQALDRILASPKLSEKGKKRLTHARNIQRNVVRMKPRANKFAPGARSLATLEKTLWTVRRTSLPPRVDREILVLVHTVEATP